MTRSADPQRLTLGIDEAGRGPVLGPLVIAGVFLTPEQEDELSRLGIRDSKIYGSGTRGRTVRQTLADHIRGIAWVETRVASASVVDHWTGDGKLNQLEHHLAADLIEAGPNVQRIIADGARLFAPLAATFQHVEAYDRADQDFVIVAAASIIAKVERDRLLDALLTPYQQEFGPIAGGGYCNRATAAFLRAHSERYGTLPQGTRRSWSWHILRELIASAQCD